MRVLSLFSGGGLGDYGLTLAGMEIVGQVEIDEYCQKILALRWPDVPKWRDIREVKGAEVLEKVGTIDLISGGFPCKPYSTAARGRNNAQCFWSEMFRIISEIKPKYVIAENVVQRAIRMAEDDIRIIGYGTTAKKLSSYSLGADHQRNRWWLFAHSNRNCQFSFPKHDEVGLLPKIRGGVRYAEDYARTVRVVDGATNRMDRLIMCGNGQDVRQAEWIGKRIMEFDAPGTDAPTPQER